MNKRETQELRRATNPLFNGNKMKLGIFGHNCSNGCAITLAEGHLETTWPNTKAISVLANQAGLEALVPIARWRGFGGPTNFNGRCFETYTWAAGLASATDYSAVFSTSHVPTVHPIMAAKQATTIDHISGGRFALNVVCGWFQPELEMFGASIMEHDIRYEYAAEWLEILFKLWTAEEEFDHEGKYFRIKKGFHEPKPIQRPFPAVMNAGGSDVGHRFAAKYADMVFVFIRQHDYGQIKAQVDELQTMARREFNREIQVWMNGYVVCRPTEKEARDYLNYYVREKGDWEAVDNLTRIIGIQSGVLPPEAIEAHKFHFIAGWAGYPLVGTPEQIVTDLEKLAATGIAGCLLSWVNYEEELQQWIREVLPLMEQAGLRKPFQRTL
jgi:alkanesulfonate monooxygenase SsuD/methylene tetrahydromethanopterin reductase-like flavin-dependent oxidoreductase (luciferase family)